MPSNNGSDRIGKLMKKTLLLMLALGLASSTVYAQSCNDSISESTPDSRFELTDDEAFDVRTDLTWKRCVEGMSWNTDTSTCEGVELSLTWQEALGQADGEWRVPNLKELLSIVENSCGSPAINETVFPETSTTDFFWSGSPYVNNELVWTVLFDKGGDDGSNKSTAGLVRLVKDAN